MSFRKVCDRCMHVWDPKPGLTQTEAGWSEWRLSGLPDRETLHFCNKCTRIIRLIFRIPLAKIRDGVAELQRNDETTKDPLFERKAYGSLNPTKGEPHRRRGE